MSAKLAQAGLAEMAKTIANCGTEPLYRRCDGCGKVDVFVNHCDLSICPRCQPRLAAERAREMEFWSKLINQPKHIVLTIPNTDTLTSQDITDFHSRFNRLRKSKVCRDWKGGMYSMEVTNNGKGWHLHMHVLVDTPWVDIPTLIARWASIIGHHTAVVWVKDARREDYLAEVCKYAVKGTELAAWDPATLAMYIAAVDGHRLFGTFGSLWNRRGEWTQCKEAQAEIKEPCICGSSSWTYLDRLQWEEYECTGKLPAKKKWQCGLEPPD